MADDPQNPIQGDPLDWQQQVIDQLDWHWQSFVRPRLERLSDAEYFWEPDPAPLTTIAWRLGHISVGVLGIRTSRHFGDGKLTFENAPWPGTAQQGLDYLDEQYAAWNAGIRTTAPRCFCCAISTAPAIRADDSRESSLDSRESSATDSGRVRDQAAIIDPEWDSVTDGPAAIRESPRIEVKLVTVRARISSATRTRVISCWTSSSRSANCRSRAVQIAASSSDDGSLRPRSTSER
jgi:hypothetical protein